jgi:hypothetical protein
MSVGVVNLPPPSGPSSLSFEAEEEKKIKTMDMKRMFYFGLTLLVIT